LRQYLEIAPVSVGRIVFFWEFDESFFLSNTLFYRDLFGRQEKIPHKEEHACCRRFYGCSLH